MAALRRRRRRRRRQGPLQPGRRDSGHREPPRAAAARRRTTGARSSPTTTRAGTSTTSSPRAARYRGAAEADPDAVQAALVADASAAETCAELVDAGGPADLRSSREADLPGGVSRTPRLGDGRGPRARAGRRPDLQRRRLAAQAAQPARDGRPRGGPPHARRRHRGRSRARGRRDPARLGSHGWPARRRARMDARAAATPAPGPRARSSRRSSGSATTATRATARRGPARATARRTSTSRGCRAATARARSSRRARGSWRSPCRQKAATATGAATENSEPRLPALAPRTACPSAPESRRRRVSGDPARARSAGQIPSGCTASVPCAGVPSPLFAPTIPHERVSDVHPSSHHGWRAPTPALRRASKRERA